MVGRSSPSGGRAEFLRVRRGAIVRKCYVSPSGLAKSGGLVSALRTNASLVTIFTFESGWQRPFWPQRRLCWWLADHLLLLEEQRTATGEGVNRLLQEGLLWLFKRPGKALKSGLCPWGMATIDGVFL